MHVNAQLCALKSVCPAITITTISSDISTFLPIMIIEVCSAQIMFLVAVHGRVLF